MASLLTVKLSKGDSPSWGFRLQGGKDFGTPLIIQKVIVGSPAERAGLVAGDSVIRVNASDVFNLRHKDAQDILLRAGNSFDMTIQRGGSTWKPSVVSTGSISTPSPNIHNISPVTRTSLAAKPSENIGAIGTGHNVSAKPFLNGTANGGPKVVNNQYNSPLKLYSEESIAETLSAQTEVLSTGALGVNFKKNEKNYDASKSAVLSLLKEEESNPKSSDHIDHHNASSEIDSTSSPISVACLRHVAAPENKPQPPTPQLPPGQNICADCERLIVGVFVRIKDKNLHVECFKCSTCGTSLKNIGYYNINNKLYCDIHAKLAAKNNPPAPNLVPVTISPGKKAPINAISSALASHPYPSSAPLSPKVNSYQNSLSGSKPFGSVAAPISPSSNYNSLPRTVAPLSPITPISAPSYSPVSSTAHSVTNIVWPPVQEEPELPSACPLFYPPPSNIIIKPRIRQVSENSDNSELDELNSFSYPYNRMDETTSITGRKSTTECAETITETVERQRLIETIIKDRPEPPTFKLPIFKDSETDKRKNFECTEKISAKKELEEATIIQTKVMESGQQPTYKIRDPVPKKWESQMLQALTISVDSKESEEIIEESLTNIPTKKTTTALGSALAVAPTEPFNPIETSSLEHVPLPEETVPYFPPEDLFSIRLNLEDRVKSNKRKKDANMEKILEDLPKPQEKLNMLAALTTAPERPFTPANFEELIIKESEAEIRKETTTTTSMEQVENKMSKTILDTKKTDNQSDSESSPEILPSFQGFTCSFQNKTDHSKLDIQISTTPPVLDKKHKEKKKSHEKTISEKNLIEEKNTKEKQTKMIQEERTNIIYKKPEQMISLRKPDSLPQYQISVKENAEADIIMMDKIEKSKQRKEEMQQKSEIIRKQDTVTATQFEESSKSIQQLKEMQTLESCSACPLIKVQAANIHRSENTFKPVVDSRPESCTFSPRPLTPSMVNKPPPIIPYYQANLVAQKYGPPTINLLNPKSPGISRSPSPLQQTPKQSQLFSTKSSNIRPKSPAQGPPLNPMQKDFIPNIEDFKRDEAKDSLTVFIPQYKEKIEMKQEIEKQKALNRDQGEIFSSYSDTRQETVTAPQTEYEKSIEKQIISSDNHSTICEIEGEKKKKTNDKQTQAIHSHIYGNIESISKLSENLHSEKSEELKKMKTRSTESSADGSLQIQRTKTVTEEMEHEHKSQEIIMETNITHTGQCFRNVINPEELNQHVVGMHVTSPSHIKSPFLKSAVSAPPKLNTVCQKIGKDIICKSKSDCIECSEKLGPCKPTFNAANIPKPIKVPNLQEETEGIRNPIKPVKHVDSPGSSKPNHKLNPNVPPSDLGAAGGRQTGAIGVAPKRGRGVLNSAQLGGRIPLCGHCHGQIRGPFITALGKIWCPSHFICATPSCKRPLQDLGFVEEQNQLYCEYCFEQYLAPNCTKCGSKIKGDCLRAIGKSFHPECFNCVHCGKLFGNSPFFLEDGSPYCETDWNELFTTKCFACGFPVEAGDRWVEALNNNYHSQCFNCTMCKKNLEGQSFFAKGGRPYCKNHAR